MSIRSFQFHKLVGKGAFGDVFKVTRKSDGQVYALKKVNINSMSDREVQDALNEIRFMASVRHRNVVGYLESFLDTRNMNLCIVMDYAGGGDLAGVIEDHKRRKQYIDEDRIWRYFVQICEGLQALHAMKILHRDLKCANCFLAPEGEVKLGDFNVSKLVKGGLALTQIGTPYYMSPEIWRNKPYDEKSDVWAVGCILYELAALRPPFRGRDLEELGKRVTAGFYPRIPSRYSAELEEMIRRLLVVNPRGRPTVADVLSMPSVSRRREALQDAGALDATLMERPALLDTIQVPRNMTRLTRDLPKPCYPDTRPNSPQSWPVTERRRREVQRAESKPGGSLPTVAEGRTEEARPARGPVAPIRARNAAAAARQELDGLADPRLPLSPGSAMRAAKPPPRIKDRLPQPAMPAKYGDVGGAGRAGGAVPEGGMALPHVRDARGSRGSSGRAKRGAPASARDGGAVGPAAFFPRYGANAAPAAVAGAAGPRPPMHAAPTPPPFARQPLAPVPGMPMKEELPRMRPRVPHGGGPVVAALPMAGLAGGPQLQRYAPPQWWG